MSSDPYWYHVKYQDDVAVALQKLREREFQAGRYNPVIPFPFELFPIGSASPAPGAQHSSIGDALEDAAEEGTRSILDLDHISDSPAFRAVSPVSDEVLRQAFGTAMPTRTMLPPEAPIVDFLADIERGHGVYVVLYEGHKPTEIVFIGYSFD